jgi:hypothetical protein
MVDSNKKEATLKGCRKKDEIDRSTIVDRSRIHYFL